MKKSRSLTPVVRVSTPAEVYEIVNEKKAVMSDICYHCTVFVVSTGDTQPVLHSSDDGEPSRMTGRPMFDVFIDPGLINVVVVITRYFGETPLDTGGLVRAYSDSVRGCLEGALVVVRDCVPARSVALPHTDAGRYLSELVGIGVSVEPEYEAGGARIAAAHLDADAIASLSVRLSSGSIRPEPKGARTVEAPTGATHNGPAKR